MAAVESIVRAAGAPILVLEKLDKRFGATHALRAVDLTFEEGEIHAIVGENGAGKSTLIKVLTAVHPRTSGEVYWQGKSVPLANPHESIGLGINAVHQEVVLCPHLTVAANIFLGDEEMRGGLLDKRRMVRDAQSLLDDLGFTLPAGRAPVLADHRPAAARRHGARRAARREIPHLRRADRLSHPPGSGGAVQADPPAQGPGRHDRLHQPSPRRGVRALRPRLGAARRRAGRHAQGQRNQRGRSHRADDQPHDRADLSQGRGPDRRDDPGDRQAQRTRLSGCLDPGARRRDRRALRPDRRRPQRVRAERVRPPSGDRRPHRLARARTSGSAPNGRR